jgi:ketol-acid reductoisomerase
MGHESGIFRLIYHYQKIKAGFLKLARHVDVSRWEVIMVELTRQSKAGDYSGAWTGSWRSRWNRFSLRMADRAQQQIEELIREIRKIMDEGAKRAERQQSLVDELQKCVTKIKKITAKKT